MENVAGAEVSASDNQPTSALSEPTGCFLLLFTQNLPPDSSSALSLGSSLVVTKISFTVYQ